MKSPPCPYPDCDGTCTVEVISRVCGLGHDPNSSGDYKVVRIVGNYYHHPKDYEHGCLKKGQVYSLSDDCWKEIEIEIEEDVIGCATYVDGFCYWIAQRTAAATYTDGIIVSFDLTNLKFSTIGLPRPLRFVKSGHILMDFEGSLGLIFFERKNVFKILHPWVRVTKDGRYQWSKEMGFKVEVQAQRPLGYFRKGQVLLLEGHYSKLMAYDSTSRQLSKTDQIYDYPLRMMAFPYFRNSLSLKLKCSTTPYVESSVLLEKLDTTTSAIPLGGEENASGKIL